MKASDRLAGGGVLLVNGVDQEPIRVRVPPVHIGTATRCQKLWCFYPGGCRLVLNRSGVECRWLVGEVCIPVVAG